jgi:hypothetical protein
MIENICRRQRDSGVSPRVGISLPAAGRRNTSSIPPIPEVYTNLISDAKKLAVHYRQEERMKTNCFIYFVLFFIYFSLSIVPIIEIFLKQKGGGLNEEYDDFGLFSPIFSPNCLGSGEG